MPCRPPRQFSPPQWGWRHLVLALVLALFPTPSRANDERQLRQEILPRYIPRQRRLRDTLAAIDQLQAVGRSAEALKTVQWILDQPFDALVFGEDRPPTSVRSLAEAKLRSFPPEWRQQYERIYGAEAKFLLEEARHRQEDRFAIEILRRFRLTAIADEAALWLALRWLDRGEAELAAAVLIPDRHLPNHLQELSSLRLSLGRIAAEAAGNISLAQSILEELRDRADPIAQSAVQRSARPSQESPPKENERLSVLAEPEQQARARDAVPVMQPLWSASLERRQNSPHLKAVRDAWRSHLQESNQRPVVPQSPLVVRGQLIVRDFEGLSGFDVENGRLMWRFPCESSLSAWVDEAARNPRFTGDVAAAFSPELLNWWFGSNTQLYHLSSDGIRLYAVDSFPMPIIPGMRQDPFQSRNDEAAKPNESNRLLALELSAPTAAGECPPPKLIWSYGRSLHETGKDARDRFFFGPPTPSAGRLLCLAETDREVRLMALQAETGAVLWEQPVAAADRPAAYDGERAFIACPPIVSGGLILCPTQVGVLSAVDAVTGSLRWSYFDHDLPVEPANRSRGITVYRGRSGFSPRTVVQRNRVVHLPTFSSVLHCLDLETGRQLWTRPRQRACSIAQVTDELVVLLEDQACRAVSLIDGSDVWHQPLGPIIGTGLDFGTEYLAPLEDGRFALLETQTGRALSWQPRRSDVSLGNLSVCGDFVLSVGPDGVEAFPQAQHVRRELAEGTAGLDPVERLLLNVNLNLADGNLAQAERLLSSALHETVSDGRQGELRRLLRELLYQQLAEKPEEASPVLARLEKLAETPEERGRYLARQARWGASRNDLSGLDRSLRELSRLPLDVAFPSADEAGWRQTAGACCRQMLSEVEVEHPEFAREFRQSLVAELSRRKWQPEALGDWRFALLVCGDDPSAGPLRAALAREMFNAGNWHAAELLWWQNRRAADVQLAADSAAGLVAMWRRAGWPRDAAGALRQLSHEFADVRLAKELTGRTFAARFSTDDDVVEWMRRMEPPKGRVGSVTIRSTTSAELPAVENLTLRRGRGTIDERDFGRYGEFSRRIGPNEPLSADVLASAQSQPPGMIVVDRSVSRPVRTFSLPARYSHPAAGGSALQAHFVPIAAPEEFRGYSLLALGEDAPVWTQRPAALAGRRAVPAIGPGGPTFVTYQVQNMLFVCDPWDGTVLWERDNLEPNSGLYADPRGGIAGDEQCLFVLGADRTSYTLYETHSGRALRRGRLDLEARHPRWAYGRKIVATSQVRGQWQVRVWDALTDRWELEELLGERNTLTLASGTPEIGWLAPSGALRMYDVLQARSTMNLALPKEELEGLNALRVVVDGERCYVNLWRNQQVVQTRDYTYPLQGQEALLSWIPHVRDDFYAIDRRTGRILWKRPLPSRTLLQLDPPGLPLLVFVSLIRDRHDGNVRSLLVEVLDAETGDVLGRRDQLPLDRMVNVEYDGESRTLRLVGQKTEIELQLLPEAPTGLAGRNP